MIWKICCFWENKKGDMHHRFVNLFSNFQQWNNFHVKLMKLTRFAEKIIKIRKSALHLGLLIEKDRGKGPATSWQPENKVLIPLPDMPETDERIEFTFLPVLPRVSF
jgi:hypothetical protein